SSGPNFLTCSTTHLSIAVAALMVARTTRSETAALEFRPARTTHVKSSLRCGSRSRAPWGADFLLRVPFSFLINRPQLTVDPLCISFSFVGAASQGLSGSIGGSVKGDLCLTRGRFC